VPHRFFVSANCITPPTVTLTGDTARQINTVLRMQPGDEIIVLDNSGQAFNVTLTGVSKRDVTGEITGQRRAPAEPALHLTLYQGTLKAQKFEWVLQKGTELGVARFVPTICRRSVVRDESRLAGKQTRWQQIIREAAEQSGRGRLPQLASAQSLAQALREARSLDLALMPWEEMQQSSLKQALAAQNLTNIGLFIGPEGGFCAEEAEQAKQAGAALVTLGPRILRAETAGLAACAAVFYQLGDWD
jgi:16S rRNA (uracil1498-N3)-methyltransferase